MFPITVVEKFLVLLDVLFISLMMFTPLSGKGKVDLEPLASMIL